MKGGKENGNNAIQKCYTLWTILRRLYLHVWRRRSDPPVQHELEQPDLHTVLVISLLEVLT